MTLKQKFQNEIETESTASLNMGDVLSWGVLIFGEGQALAVAANEMTGPKTTLLSLSCNSFQFRDPFSKIVRNAPIAPPGEPLESLIQFQFHKLFTKILPIP